MRAVHISVKQLPFWKCLFWEGDSDNFSLGFLAESNCQLFDYRFMRTGRFFFYNSELKQRSKKSITPEYIRRGISRTYFEAHLKIQSRWRPEVFWRCLGDLRLPFLLAVFRKLQPECSTLSRAIFQARYVISTSATTAKAISLQVPA